MRLKASRPFAAAPRERFARSHLRRTSLALAERHPRDSRGSRHPHGQTRYAYARPVVECWFDWHSRTCSSAKDPMFVAVPACLLQRVRSLEF